MRWPKPPAPCWEYRSTNLFRRTLGIYRAQIQWRVDHSGTSDFPVDFALTAQMKWDDFVTARNTARVDGHDPRLEPFSMALDHSLPIEGFWCLRVGFYLAYYQAFPGPEPKAVGSLVFHESDPNRPKDLRATLESLRRQTPE